MLESLFSSDELKEFKIVDWGSTENPIPDSFSKFNSWVEEGKHLPLHYLSDHRKEKRRDLKNYFPEFQSALVFLFSYQKEKQYLEKFYNSNESNGLKMASYVMGFDGNDYHHQIKDQLNSIRERLESKIPGLKCALTLDIHPVLERDLAYRSGLGWFGKNSMFISKKFGSYTIIGSLLLNKKIGPSKNTVLEADHCGQCRACIPACPTGAIDITSRQIVAEKCLSTYTIELFKDADAIPGGENCDEIFGCDICQDVCPWNQRLLRFDEEVIAESQGEKFQKIKSFFLFLF